MGATSTPALPVAPTGSVTAPVALVPAASPAAVAAPAPCRTLYVRNLCEKRKKEQLRVLLHALFSPYGEIEWISAYKTIKLRGQAFITFRDIAGATTAMRRLQGTSFLSRPLRIAYARSETDRAIPAGSPRSAARKARKSRPRATTSAAEAVGTQADDVVEMDVMEEPAKDAPMEPNRILFAQKVPAGDELAERCTRFAGFVEVRPVPGKSGIAFVEFSSEANAAIAVAALDGVVLVDEAPPLQIAYAKK